MELFELILLLLICVMASAVLDQVISRMSLPLLQIAVGLVAALIMPHLADVHVDEELFMMLFIAPLLFVEAKETNRITLWKNRWSILSMAIVLVVVSVLAAGSVLHWIIPSIALAAAFSCTAALGPTDAAAVAALGSTIELTERQSSLLSGEALINDASGVVAFQFAIAAAVTGSFSAANALGSFSILFFGGIFVGLIIGYVAKRLMHFLRRLGYVSTTIHVIYEVLSPFLIFLAAEELHVSGVLAVVAAGLVMQEHSINMVSAEMARHEMVANSCWEVIVFLINGVIFVMLGMQLPKVMQPADMEGIPAVRVLAAVLAVTVVIVMVRLLWIFLLEMIHKAPETGIRGSANPKNTAFRALVTTIAGPKGAVTLSIILTIPLAMMDGSPFPYRDLIIFVTAGVILCTLLLADILLPRIAPKARDRNQERHLQIARAQVLQGVVDELKELIEENPNADFTPALRLALMQYRSRLMNQRFVMGDCGVVLKQVMQEVLDVQQKRADEIQSDLHGTSELKRMPYYAILPGIRASIGYFDGAEYVGSRFETKKGRMFFRLLRNKPHDFDDEQAARVYYDTCRFAIELEHAAIDFLQGLIDASDYAEPVVCFMPTLEDPDEPEVQAGSEAGAIASAGAGTGVGTGTGTGAGTGSAAGNTSGSAGSAPGSATGSAGGTGTGTRTGSAAGNTSGSAAGNTSGAAGMDMVTDIPEGGTAAARAGVAQMLLPEHEACLQFLWGRINYGQEAPQADDGNYDHGFHEQMPEGMRANTAEQFKKARRFMEEVDASALNMELDQIQKLRTRGLINEEAARELREQVYLMQTVYI